MHIHIIILNLIILVPQELLDVMSAVIKFHHLGQCVEITLQQNVSTSVTGHIIVNGSVMFLVILRQVGIRVVRIQMETVILLLRYVDCVLITLLVSKSVLRRLHLQHIFVTLTIHVSRPLVR